MRIDSPMMVLPFEMATVTSPCTSMSTEPRNTAPSAMRMRGERMSPTTLESLFSSTLLLAMMLPVTCPDTSTFGRLDVGFDDARALDEEALLERDASLDRAEHDQVLVAGDLAVDDDRRPDQRVSARARRRRLLDSCCHVGEILRRVADMSPRCGTRE